MWHSREFSNKSVSKEIINSMINSLIHRGPDFQDYYINDKFNLFIGHTRLSILDISQNANQPMVSNNGRYILSYNGEIYNYLKLKEELINRFEISWKGNGDTEVLLNSIQYNGIYETLQKIEGMYSFVIFDQKLEKLILVRDAFGEKPLYFGNSNNRFYFSSELKAITKDLNFGKKLCKSSVKFLMGLNYIPSPLSIYDKIFKLKHGHYVEIDLNKHSFENNNFKQIKYTKNQTVSIESGNFIDNKNKLKKLLFESVENKLSSDVDLGSFLSSGVDSSIISTIASRISRKNSNFFSRLC